MTYNHSQLKLFHSFFIVIIDKVLVFKIQKNTFHIVLRPIKSLSKSPGHYGMKIHDNNTWP